MLLNCKVPTYKPVWEPDGSLLQLKIRIVGGRGFNSIYLAREHLLQCSFKVKPWQLIKVEKHSSQVHIFATEYRQLLTTSTYANLSWINATSFSSISYYSKSEIDLKNVFETNASVLQYYISFIIQRNI